MIYGVLLLLAVAVDGLKKYTIINLVRTAAVVCIEKHVKVFVYTCVEDSSIHKFVEETTSKLLFCET